MNKLKSVRKKAGARIVIKKRTGPPPAAKSEGKASPEGAEPDVDTVNRSLRSILLFQDVPTDALSHFEDTCRWCRFDPDKKIVEKGDKSSDVYFILAGGAHVLNFRPSGRVVDFSVLGPGDFFGELAAIDGLPRSATVVTKGPCQMAVFSAGLFLELVTSHFDVTMTILKRMASIIRTGDERITNLSVLDAEQRLCLELLRLAVPDPAYIDNIDDLVVFPVPTQQLIANNIGIARETVARIFGRLSGEGIIERKAKILYIRDKSALEALTLPFDE